MQVISKPVFRLRTLGTCLGRKKIKGRKKLQMAKPRHSRADTRGGHDPPPEKE